MTPKAKKQDILDPTILKCMENGFGLSKFFKAHPYKWNKETRLVQNAPRNSRFCWKIFITIGILCTIYVVFRGAGVVTDKSSTTGQRVYIRLMVSYYSIAGVLHLAMVLNRNDIPGFVNQYLVFGRQFRRIHGELKSEKTEVIPKICSGLMQIFIVYCNFICLVMASNAFLHPHYPDQITSLLPSEFHEWMLVRIVCFVIVFLVLHIFTASATAIVFSILPFIVQCILLLNAISQTARMQGKNFWNKTHDKLKVWRTIQVQMMWFNRIFSNQAIVGFQVLGLLLSSYCIYSVIRMKGIFRIVFGVMGAFMLINLVSIYLTLAEIHSRSGRVLKEWQTSLVGSNNGRERWLKRFLKSLLPLKVKIESSYYIDRPILLTMVDIIVTNTVTMLIIGKGR